MKNLTIIIPLHKFDDTVAKYLLFALKVLKDADGVSKSKVMLVGPSDVLGKAEAVYMEAEMPQDLVTVENEDTNVFVQINKGAYACTTKYFSIMEFDDMYEKTWFTNVKAHIAAKGNVSMFMPIVRLVSEKSEVIGSMNEIIWSPSFSDDIGVVSLDALMAYMDFNVTGSVIKTEDFISIGGLKPSMKIAAWYEYLLRATHNGKRTYVIPRYGYVHVMGRADGYNALSKDEISLEEGAWLIDTAKQEYFFKEDRKKVWNKEEEAGEDKDA